MMAVAAFLLTIACTKENNSPAFKPEGTWRGNIYTMSALLLNKENGKCRIYIGTMYEDTTNVSYAWDGNYTKTAKGYEFKFMNEGIVTCVLQADQVTSDKMQGKAFVLQAALDFDLKKY